MEKDTLTRQLIHFKAILGNIGLLLHVPALMAFLSILISIIFHEHYSILPFLVTTAFGIILGQILFHLFFKPDVIHVWDAMITAAIGWVLCSALAMVPFIWIAYVAPNSSEIIDLTSPVNALFESISGFTSTGLTIVKNPEDLPRTLQWWRSLLEWVGGMGLIVFIISLTEPNKEEFQLYYAEARTEQIGKNMTQTARLIWGVYGIFTLFSALLLFVFGMPIWESINHALSGISTGGFSIKNNNFISYSPQIKIATMFIVLLGMMSFSLHFKVVRKREFSSLYKNNQNRWLLLLVFFGAGFIELLHLWNRFPISWIDSVFQWITALGTCGFHTVELPLWPPMSLLLLILAMIIGGASGSTAGGIKIRRLRNLFQGIKLRLLSLTEKKEKVVLDEMDHTELKTSKEPSEVYLPHSEKTQRLYAASILFSMWVITLLLGWFFILRWLPYESAFTAFFDVVSAMSNCGLSSGVASANLASAPKIIFICLMWLGRLEIVPALILFLTIPHAMRCKRNQ